MAKTTTAPASRKTGSKHPKFPVRITPNQLRSRLAQAFNEWMRRYTEDPAGFAKEYETVGAFVRDRNEGREPSYGDRQAAYLEELMTQLSK